ncbi:FecCD family ABC transporter permease [Streptomyces sp. CA-250714]|uniref:FecCD family ABC transporter permease n=1 Tax=Streptomyces sp. CA-250714 TaxID=3240060 RepID=UPI003D944CB5
MAQTAQASQGTRAPSGARGTARATTTKPQPANFRKGHPLSGAFRTARGATLLCGIGVLALAISIAAAITVGQAGLGVTDVWRVVIERLGGADAGVSPLREGIIVELRLPRAMLAALCGAGLGLCGAVLQSLLRNPLADPFVLGVSSGASTGAVAVVVLGVGGGALSLSAGAFAGAALSFALVLLLAHTSGGTTDRVLLSGIAGMQLFSALTSLIVFTSADAEQTRGVLFWLLGSLGSADWNEVALGAAALVVALVVCLARADALDAFAFGSEAAASLGVPVRRVRLTLLLVTALLTAVLVSSAGAIGFVGLVLPHAARALTGPAHRRLLPVTALVGAVFLVWVDTAARTLLAPRELPVGVATSLLGVPAFVVILHRGRRARAGGGAGL